jgi:antirestriction protein ArdC
MEKRDVYQEVTDRIVSALEAGTVPWLRPWKDGKAGSVLEPFNAATGRAYNGINLLVLGTLPYAELGYLTFRQAQALGGSVRKGERGTGVVFWQFLKRKDEASGKVKIMPWAKMYTVFNVAQCEGIDRAKLVMPVPPVAGDTSVNLVAAQAGADVRHGGNKAFYTTAGDYIGMPSAEAFAARESYQATLAHELVHWTGHEKRCARVFGRRFGDHAYAAEELVAEIGSAFLCARLGVPLEGLQHPAYVANWLKVLKGDKRAIFTAATAAKKASLYLLPEIGEEAEKLAA